MNTAPRTISAPERNPRTIYWRRRAVALGLTAVAALGVYKLGEKIHDTIEFNNLVDQIENSGDHAVADFNDGKFDKKPVVKYEVQNGQGSFGVASAVTPKGGNVLDTQEVITSQTGDQVDSHEELVIPTKLVRPELLEQQRERNLIPNDPNTHVN